MPYKIISSLTAILMTASMFVATPVVAADHEAQKPPLTNCYFISSGLWGGNSLNLELAFNSKASDSMPSVTGMGVVSFPYLLPSVHSKLTGSYWPILFRGTVYKTHVFAQGYPPVEWSKNAGIGPEIPPNLKLNMTLGPNLEEGTASYKYRQDWLSEWVSVNDVPVKEIPCNVDTNVETQEKPESDSAVVHNSAILLNPHFVNELKLGGELGWYITEQNASTGYYWQFIPDESGVYKLVETVTLYPSVTSGGLIVAGAGGDMIWKFKGIRSGKGSMMFQLHGPGGKKPLKTVIVDVEVVK